MTRNGGTTWSALRCTGRDDDWPGHVRVPEPERAVDFTGFNGYPQPTLVAFDPDRSGHPGRRGGADSGVFLSSNGGTRWQLVTDPTRQACRERRIFRGRTTRTSIMIRPAATSICISERAVAARGG